MKVATRADDAALEVVIPVDEARVHWMSIALLLGQHADQLVRALTRELPFAQAEVWGVVVATGVAPLELQDAGKSAQNLISLRVIRGDREELFLTSNFNKAWVIF